jgi:transcriptional regulator with XRE-family HTH domain
MKNDLLRKAREGRGWTQRILAKEMDVEEQTVSSWERGIRAPSVELRLRLATVLGKPLTELGLELPSLEYVHDIIALYDPAIPPMGFPVGRDTLLQALKEQMQQGDPGGRFALHGLPGVGKTMLASILAHDRDIRNVFPDGILWAGLGPTPNITGLLSHWGILLGVSSDQMATIQNNEAWAITLCTTIGARKMLLMPGS